MCRYEKLHAITLKKCAATTRRGSCSHLYQQTHKKTLTSSRACRTALLSRNIFAPCSPVRRADVVFRVHTRHMPTGNICPQNAVNALAHIYTTFPARHPPDTIMARAQREDHTASARMCNKTSPRPLRGSFRRLCCRLMSPSDHHTAQLSQAPLSLQSPREMCMRYYLYVYFQMRCTEKCIRMK